MKQDVNVSLIHLLGQGKYEKIKKILRGGQKMEVKIQNLKTGESDKKTVDVVYDVNEKDYFHRSALMWSVLEKQNDIAIELIRQGADIQEKDDFNSTFVSICSEIGCYKVLKFALEQHCPTFNKMLVNATFGSYISTPLHKAVRGPFFRLAELLLKAGADPNVYDYNCLPVIAYPVISGNVKMVRLLLKYGARADLTNANGVNMMQFALGNNTPDGHIITKMLMFNAVKCNNYADFLKKAYETAVSYGNSVMATEISNELIKFA